MEESILLQIASYLEGKMSPDEMADFEKLVAENPAIKEELLLSRKMNSHFYNTYGEQDIPDNTHVTRLKKILESDEARSLKTTISEVGEEYHQENQTKKKSNYIWMYAAAAVLILFLGINFFIGSGSSDLYAEYYDENDIPSVVKRNADETALTKGVTAFENNNFKESIALFDKHEEQNDHLQISFYLLKATAYSKNKQLDKAIVYYDKVIGSTSIDASKGIWFKALAYLKEDDITNAKNTLLLLKEGDFNYTKAQHLLEDL